MGDIPPQPPETMIPSILRASVRSTLINKGPATCSEIVKNMGMDPQEHKGTIHALMLDMERQRVLHATKHKKTGKRDLWSIREIRKRDRVAAFAFKVFRINCGCCQS